MMLMVEEEHCGLEMLHARHVWFAGDGPAEHAAVCEGYRLWRDYLSADEQV